MVKCLPWAFPSERNRPNILIQNKRKVREFFLFYKKHHENIFDSVSFVWLLLGFAIFQAIRSIRLKNISPLKGHCQGVIEIIRLVLNNSGNDR